ncbi:hypothetical protein [Bradyrhizobium japonicum]|uniref:hypothetical protein n=1 Tax=Bradyrhizobium japonicum TaxID=375 RepID=UPI001BADDBFB|nr:hypothetical protein [Bradyrhizobium japonicum]MBR0762833.1 hypothetical protein [Bradyrhizobium japonicum]
MLYHQKWDRDGKWVPRYRVLGSGDEIEGQRGLPPDDFVPLNHEAAYRKVHAIRRAIANPADVDFAKLAESVGGPSGLAPDIANHYLVHWGNLTAIRLNAGWRGVWT